MRYIKLSRIFLFGGHFRIYLLITPIDNPIIRFILRSVLAARDWHNPRSKVRFELWPAAEYVIPLSMRERPHVWCAAHPANRSL